MIVTATDFGLKGPYTGQVLAVLHAQAPAVPVISLFADLPSFDVRPAAYLLSAYSAGFPADTVFLGVVDPGVGSARRPIIIRADGCWFVGPDNGLFDVVSQRADEVQCWQISYRPEHLSASFHGRDLFAPVAAQLALQRPVPGEPLTKRNALNWPEALNEVIYLDHYGNAITGISAQHLDPDVVISIKGYRLAYARTFSEGQAGVAFWYINANGLVELALNRGSVAQLLHLQVGDTFDIR